MSLSTQLSLPDSSLFILPPAIDPITPLAPAAGTWSQNSPLFTIPESLYHGVFDARVPITIAATYAISVQLLNAYNKSNGNKPWAISKTRVFYWLVIAHNVFLAVYSLWTCVGMFNAISRTLISPFGPDGLTGTVDSLCKMHGVAGLGNAITYSPSKSSWLSQSPETVRLAWDGTPDPSDQGRLWNEGLAFYGWLFYLSKFYEVLDTVIILAKGKRSSTLQTYHHAGAMMSMWAGMRYASPPIWIFVVVNSGIHAIMYTYYTLTALSIRVPQSIKQTITTLQISQFLIGVTSASLHSFVSYNIPVQVLSNPETTLHSAIQHLKPSAAASHAVSSAIAQATATGFGSLMKKMLFRAAGEEGLAENVGAAGSSSFHANGPHAPRAANPHPAHQPGLVYHTEYQTVPCIDTSGQTFAIWLNIIYLLPLTVLFTRFFIRSYLRRTGQGKASGPIDSKKIEGKGNKHGVKQVGLDAVEAASIDAVKGIDRELNGNYNGNGDLKEINQQGKEINQSVKDFKANGNGHINGSPNGKKSKSRKG